MTSRERILRAMRGQPVDRVACCPRMWKFNRAYYGRHDPEICLKSAEEFGYDPIYYTSASAPSFFSGWMPSQDAMPEGVTVTGETEPGQKYDVVHRRYDTPAGPLTDVWQRPHPGKGHGVSPAPTPVENLVKGPEDLERLRYLITSPSQTTLAAFGAMTERFGDRGLVCPYVRSPFNDLYYVYPVAQCLMLPYDDPQFLHDMLALLQEPCLADIKAHLDAGSSTIFISGFHISLSVGWSPTIFREFFLPLIKEQVRLTHEAGAVLHYYDDGRIMLILDTMVESGIDVFSTCTPPPTGDFDLREAKARVGNKLVFMGYVDIEQVLHRGTPELVDATVKEAIEIGAADDAFVLSSSDGVLTQTPVENMRAYFEAARKYGRR